MLAGGDQSRDHLRIARQEGRSVPGEIRLLAERIDGQDAAQIAVGTSFISSVKGVKEEAVKLDPKSSENTLIFPTDDMLSQMHQNDPAMLGNPDYVQAWQAVQGQ